MEKKKNEIVWLSILQGWSMLLVVIGHVTLNNGLKLSIPIDSVAMEIQYIIYGFHMPLFMFISGFLFWITQINRKKPYGETVTAKLKRLGVPFLFFTVITLFLKFMFNPLMNRPVEFSLRLVSDAFYITGGGNPLGEMWFIFTLLILFIFYPLYKFSLQKPVYMVLLLIVSVLLNLFFPDDIDFLCCSFVAKYLVYFYSGILLSKYELYKKLNSWKAFVIYTVAFVISWIFKLPAIIIAFAGIAASFSLCLCLENGLSSLFSSFRDYTYQIFLIGIFPQMLIRFVYTKKIVDNTVPSGVIQSSIIYILLYMASIAIALYISVITAKIAEKIPLKWVRMCFGLS